LYLSHLDVTFATACVRDGDEYVLNCTVNSTIHAWSVPPFNEETISRARQEAPLQQFTLRLVATNNKSIISSLTVIASNQVNGSVIVCTDGHSTDGETQETTLIVLSAGMPLIIFCQFF
jgi:hypothetical protein